MINLVHLEMSLKCLHTARHVVVGIYAIKTKIDAIKLEKIAQEDARLEAGAYRRKQENYDPVQARYANGISKLTNHLNGLKKQYISDPDVFYLERYRSVMDELTAIPSTFRHHSTEALIIKLWAGVYNPSGNSESGFC